MDELTQTRNHLLTTTTVRSIRVTLRHSLGLIALLGYDLAAQFEPVRSALADVRVTLRTCEFSVVEPGAGTPFYELS